MGQCGNQLGHELFEALHAEGASARPELAAAVRRVYFTEEPAAGLGAPPRARAVLVDSEPRAVEGCLHPGSERRGRWQYRATGACVRQGGAANNWAFGFHHHGPAMAEDVLERVQQEAERCDRLEGFLAIHSVAGGTGSGVGSHVLQLLRDAFPSTTLAAVSVWPLESGEVSVQSYNSALSLSAAYDCADLVLMCENGRYLDICSGALKERSPSLASLNAAMPPGGPRCGRSWRRAARPQDHVGSPSPTRASWPR
ncbi:unnamed protein product [Prorocentrum cordatum]|uniref:Tubulin/FtsZ GTPase domain-containing protein n=1 Tax=Prorocentrum cordatum TaxID=2364126 RepID=A0ABN9W6V7_9DINO|nr:unnamed protein product [Polarella glacialis]